MPLTMSLYKLTFVWLMLLCPLSHRRALPGWDESDAAYEARVAYIASAIAEAAHNKREAAALVAVAVHESGLAADVESPDGCYRKGSWLSRCDGDRAVSVFQLQDADRERLALFRRDRREAAKEARERVVGSWWRCRALEPALRWSAYAGGTCAATGRAAEASREIDALMRRVLR